MPYDPTIYLGAAAHYRYGRPPYSPDLEGFLTDRVKPVASSRLLDGGCGPGILTVRLAPLFAETVGLDPDADMLAEGQRAAEARGITSVRWVNALAEDLPDVAPGPYRLVTFGQSFHWTDEHRVAETVYDLLEPGGTLALVVHTVKGRPMPPPAGVPIPQDELWAVVQKYLGPTMRAGQGFLPARTHRFEDVLVKTRFGKPESHFLPGIPDLMRDTESVVSGFFSTSFAAPHLFGDRVEEFADEMRAILRAKSPDGLFWDWPGDTEVVLARKPS